YFSGLSLRSASPIHFQQLTASGLRIHLGGQTASYCPENVQQLGACPNTTYTNFIGGNGGLSMGAVVPGGQQVYVDPTCGAVSYTQAHSAAMPANAIIDGWVLTPGGAGSYLSNTNGATIACQNNETNVWDVYLALPGLAVPDSCLGFTIITANETGAAQWQY
ncbi:hypothetical protein BAUCODRAFT_40113, partial [Baudoinia panamericana UAMH 10762]